MLCPPREVARRADDIRAARAGIVADLVEMNEAIASTTILFGESAAFLVYGPVVRHSQGVGKYSFCMQRKLMIGL